MAGQPGTQSRTVGGGDHDAGSRVLRDDARWGEARFSFALSRDECSLLLGEGRCVPTRERQHLDTVLERDADRRRERQDVHHHDDVGIRCDRRGTLQTPVETHLVLALIVRRGHAMRLSEANCYTETTCERFLAFPAS